MVVVVTGDENVPTCAGPGVPGPDRPTPRIRRPGRRGCATNAQITDSAGQLLQVRRMLI
jgi:hypothetical protein